MAEHGGAVAASTSMCKATASHTHMLVATTKKGRVCMAPAAATAQPLMLMSSGACGGHYCPVQLVAHREVPLTLLASSWHPAWLRLPPHLVDPGTVGFGFSGLSPM
eukprot:scaffold17467_cov158-Isochrysis_galbana.AAC.2